MNKIKEVEDFLKSNNIIRPNKITNSETETLVLFGDSNHNYIISIENNDIREMYYFSHISSKEIADMIDFKSLQEMISHHSNLIFI